MRNLFRALIVVMGLAAFATRAEANTVVSFPAGSIIIPSSASFQTDCGAVSMYGLVYDMLRANGWLTANGYNAITIYYAIADSTPTTWALTAGKQSPNRCKPSDVDTSVSVNNTAQSAAIFADTSWTDGCDFVLSGATQPVKLVNNNSTGSGSDSTITTYNTLNKSIVSPQYNKVSLATATQVNYGGAPFIIKNDAPNGKLLGSDAAVFLALLQGTLIAKDSQGNAIDFSPFRSPTPSVNGSGVSSCKFGTDNYVNVHRSSVLFTASIPKSFNSPPPRLALLDTNNGGGSASPSISLNGCGNAPQFTLTGNTAGCRAKNPVSFAIGDTIVVSGVKDNKYNGTWVATGVNLTVAGFTNVFEFDMGISGESASTKGNVQPSFTAEPATKSVSGGILKNYLNNAGLAFDGAQGCPTGGTNALDTNLCPIGGTAGQIYDAFDFADLANNKLALLDASGSARYQMIWTPHWDTSANAGSPPTGPEATALGYINTFLDGQTGLFAECAAITSYEGSYEGGSAQIEGATPTQGNLQLQSCPDNGAGACTGGSTLFGLARNASGVPSGNLKNCSDVTTTSGACAYFGYPQDPFAQIADFSFTPTGGETHDWSPNTGSVYRPGVLTLISGVNSLTNRGALTSPATMRASAQIVTDWFTRNVKDNIVGKGNVAYLGGHDQTGSVGATKLVLETLLQLGTSAPVVVPVTVEVSRNSPIAATIGAVPAIVQGSFESVTPVPAAPVIAAAGDIGVWTFPAVYGHMRATADTLIGAAAQKFGQNAAIFDAANGIPSVVTGGCGAGRFQGSCRTIFTTTQTDTTGIVGPSTLALQANPTMVFFEDGNAPTLGNLIAPGLPTIWTTIVQRVLAGVPDGTGSYLPKLGGVDRSTVAVIEPSLQAGTAGANRPTMAYFGATDGMLHAVCASSAALTPCAVKGRELWAFMPRTQLPFVELNTTRIDGSPHVADVFGSFGAATKTFHTILTFQTGSGAAVTGSRPAIYALDITDPTAPKLLWEVTAPDVPTTPAVGTGLAMANGVANIGGQSVNLLYAETNNGGTGGTGIVVTAINVEDGSIKWQWNTIYPAVLQGGDQVVPASGIPGGVVAVDQTGQGFTTDLVFGDLFGQMWLLNPGTGASRYTNAGPVDRPLFAFTTDYHAFGSMPAVYSNGTKQFAIGVSGTFDDPADTWGALTPAAQSAVAVDLSTPAAAGQLSELSSTTYVPFQIPLGTLSGTNLQGSAQALVVGGQLFITTDNSDVNKVAYGLGAAQTGSMITYSIGAAVSTATATTIAGGAGSVANAGTALFTGAGQSQQQMTAATTTTGPSVDSGLMPKLTRNLWLRTL